MGSLPTFAALQRSGLTNLAVTSVDGPLLPFTTTSYAAVQLSKNGRSNSSVFLAAKKL
jgi:hypothetical protein